MSTIKELRLKSIIGEDPPLLTRGISNLFVVTGHLHAVNSFKIRCKVEKEMYNFMYDTTHTTYEEVIIDVVDLTFKQLQTLMKKYIVNVYLNEQFKPNLFRLSIRDRDDKEMPF